MQMRGIYTVSKNDTDLAHYNFDTDQPILIILAEMLLGQIAIKRWYPTSPKFLTVSTLPAET